MNNCSDDRKIKNFHSRIESQVEFLIIIRRNNFSKKLLFIEIRIWTSEKYQELWPINKSAPQLSYV